MIRNIFIICTGLGQIRRGYESFTQEVFEVLSQEPSLRVTLFKGGGQAGEQEIPLWNLPRNSWTARRIARFRKFSKFTKADPYVVEEFTFFLSLLPFLQSHNPDLIYFSDNEIGDFLWYWRSLTQKKYKLLFSNGGPLKPDKYTIFSHCDRIQQLAPTHLKTALEAGIPLEKQTLVPYGAHIKPTLKMLSAQEKQAARRKLSLPEDRPIILSVGAIGLRYKRMDYVIEEVADLPEPRPYLLLLGQQDSESKKIIQLGNTLLGTENFQVRSASYQEMPDYYQVVDIFTLGSLREEFGRVFVEAMSYGLPCLANDYEVTRFVLGEAGYFGKLAEKGSLSTLIQQVLSDGLGTEKCYSRHQYVYEKFSWDKLRSNYVEMIHQCL